jgi:hypothetical protein
MIPEEVIQQAMRDGQCFIMLNDMKTIVSQVHIHKMNYEQSFQARTVTIEMVLDMSHSVASEVQVYRPNEPVPKVEDQDPNLCNNCYFKSLAEESDKPDTEAHSGES